MYYFYNFDLVSSLKECSVEADVKLRRVICKNTTVLCIVLFIPSALSYTLVISCNVPQHFTRSRIFLGKYLEHGNHM